MAGAVLPGAALGRAAEAAGASAAARVPIEARVEISFLLGYVDGSACTFQRNGALHSAADAQSHLREKYANLAARGQIASAEDFIGKVATRSSFTGEDYVVHCAAGTEMTSSAWLRVELARLRGM
jgi:hypothetical protein